MARIFREKKLVVASHNTGKVREISALLKRFSINIISSGELGLDEPIEDGDSFEANAQIKAVASAKASGLPALADDSGLVVPALGGRPGIYSARLAGPHKDFNMAMKSIMDELSDKDNTAYFVCVLSLAWPDGHVESFEGRVYGTLTWPMRGTQGFGYDPIFIAKGYDKTFGEFDPQEKHKISHRAQAFQKLIEACFEPK